MYKQTIGDLDTLEAQEAMQSWELSKVPTQALKDELASREHIRKDLFGVGRKVNSFVDTPEQHEICKHNMEMGYCPVDGCTGSY